MILLFTRMFFLLTLCLYFTESPVNADTKYLFWQQTNDACLLAAAYNLNRLETLQRLYSDKFTFANIKTIADSEWFSHRQWFGKEYLLLKAWHESIDSTITLGDSQQDQEDTETLRKFLESAVNVGPVGPYVYNKKGKILFTGYFEKLGIPFFLYEYETIPENIQPELGIFSPIVQENGTWKTFSSTQQQFVEITPPTINPEWKTFTFPVAQNPENPASTPIAKGNATPYFSIITDRYLGFDTMTKTYETARGLRINNKTYVPYLIGLYKLILLTLGIDIDNNVVPEQGHALSPICNALKRRVGKDPNNPWHPTMLSRDKFLQYQLTQLFKQKPDLYKAAKATVNCLYFMHGFQVYSAFQAKLNARELYKKVTTEPSQQAEGKQDLKHADALALGGKESLEKYNDPISVNNFLPGEKQALAYYVTQTIYMLWYGAMSPRALIKAFGIDEWRATCLLPAAKMWVHFNERSARKKINIQGQEPQSFLDVWKKIATHFKQQDRKNWYSFDGHGWVVSFDPQLFTLQQQYPIYNIHLFNDLEIAVVESWIGRMLPVFYKK